MTNHGSDNYEQEELRKAKRAREDALEMILICQKLIIQFDELAVKYPNLTDELAEQIIENKQIIEMYKKELGL